MPNQELWTSVDQFFVESLLAHDVDLEWVLNANASAGLPPIDVTPLQGKWLAQLIMITSARRVLEVGTLGGYSTIWMANAIPAGGRVTTLEIDPVHAAVAQRNFERAGVADRIECHVGPAAESLANLQRDEPGSIDLAFIDADKESNKIYLDLVRLLLRPGGLVIFDNVVRGGEVTHSGSDDPSVVGTRALIDAIAGDPSLFATAMQTVSSKGYDGFLVVKLLPPGG